MRNPVRSILALAPALLALTLLAAAPLAADLTPAGPEVRIAAVGTGEACPAATALPDGSFLAVWSTAQGRGTFTCSPAGRILARRLDRDGRPLGAPFLVGRTGQRCAGSLQLGFPAADGSVPVSWTSSEGEAGDIRLIAARIGAGNQVTRLLDEQAFAVAHLRSGAMLLFSRPDGSTGIGRGPVAQRWNADGTPGGPLFDVLPAAQEFDPATFAAAEVSPGAVAMVWGNPDGRLSGRKVRTDGSLSFSFAVADPVALHPRITSNGRGRFAVIWNGGDIDVRGQVFGPIAAPLTRPFPVNTRPDGQQSASSAQMTADGRLAVAWTSLRRAAQEGVNAVGRLFAPDGQGLGRAVQLPSDPAGPQVCGGLTAAGAAGSRWLASWLGEGEDGPGLYGRVLADR